MFIAKGNRLKREDRFTGLVHRPDPFLDTRRGTDRAQAPIGIDKDSNASRHSRPTDARDESRGLCSLLADANCVGFARVPVAVLPPPVVLLKSAMNVTLNTRGSAPGLDVVGCFHRCGFH